MESPVFKRKKFFTKAEIINKLSDQNQRVNDVVNDICETLAPFDVNDSEATVLEDQLERLDKASKALAAKVYRLQKEVKNRKYRHNTEMLEEVLISTSQHSVLQSQACDDLQDTPVLDSEPSQSLLSGASQREKYKKRPLNQLTSGFGRRRRVENKRDVVNEWSNEEGVSVTQLLGYFLYLENYHQGNRDIASIGWQLFSGDFVRVMPEASTEEDIWLVERGSLSQPT